MDRSCDAELDIRAAAELLNVSPPFLVKLLEGGQIPFRRVDEYPRVRRADVLEFKRRDTAARRAVLQLSVNEGQQINPDY